MALACSGTDSTDSRTKEQLRTAVQAYSDSFLTGDMTAYAILTGRCRDRLSADEFRTMLDAAKAEYGQAQRFRSYSADISGNLARVTYTYDDSSIDQGAEPWARESGEWHEDDC